MGVGMSPKLGSELVGAGAFEYNNKCNYDLKCAHRFLSSMIHYAKDKVPNNSFQPVLQVKKPRVRKSDCPRSLCQINRVWETPTSCMGHIS